MITDHTAAITRTSSAKSTAATCTNQYTMANRVTFIPAQIDAHAGSTARAVNENPVHGLLRDTYVLVGMLKYIPQLVSPFRTTDKYAELYPWSWLNVRDAILQMLLAIIQAITILCAPFAILLSTFLFPGGLLVAMLAVPCALIYVITLPLMGPRVVHEQPRMESNRHPDERWLFLNGCMTGYYRPIPVQ